MITQLDEVLLSQLKPFYLDIYLTDIASKREYGSNNSVFDKDTRFDLVCEQARFYISKELESEQSNDGERTKLLLLRQKKAIIGYPTEVSYFKDKIREFLRNSHLQDEFYPPWFNNLVDAIFHRNWGLDGIAPWMEMKDCSSAKIIGDRIYFLINGKMELQKQRIKPERFEQLRSALLLQTPKKRADDDYLELYMLSGERITIFTGDKTIAGQESMIFRKYIVEKLTFEEQVNKGTIPKKILPALKALVKMGVRPAFIGPVRTGKTTFLLTWQMYEDPTLEGVFVQTDPEIKINEVMPKAPILSLIADGDELKGILKSIKRTDADYIVVAEGRDGHAYKLIVDVANQGTRRNKTTLHLSNPEDFCYDIANDIVTSYGGNLNYHIVKVAKSFDFIFEFIQLAEDKSKKRLKSIYEIQYDIEKHEISYHKLCHYDKEIDDWYFNYSVGKGVETIGMEENSAALSIFKNELKKLSEEHPFPNDVIKDLYPVYGKVGVDV